VQDQAAARRRRRDLAGHPLAEDVAVVVQVGHAQGDAVFEQGQQLVAEVAGPVGGDELLSKFENREFLKPYGEQDPTILTPIPHRSGQGIRFSDPEFTMLGNIARQLKPELADQLKNIPSGQRMNLTNKTYTDVYGEIEIFSERRLCNSCDTVVKQFQAMFPNVKVNIVSGPKEIELGR
jgi:hypothetical protein